MRVEDAGPHPRQSGWVLFLCDSCREQFWGPGGGHPGALLHFCDGCRRSLLATSFHFTPGRPTPQDAADAAYHGGRFMAGEW